MRCPRCGGGRLFSSFFKMYPVCPNCGLKYERAPGYFLGSAYINYGLTTVLITVAYVTLRFGLNIDRNTAVIPLAAFCVLFPLFFFRFARSFWLAMGCFFDREGFDSDKD